MRAGAAAAGSALFFALAPGVVVGVVPWWMTRWTMLPAPLALRVAGALLVAAALPVLIAAFVRFAREGRGTPAPIAPTERLVVGGLYRHVRNPMYVAVLAAILGQAALLGQPRLVAWAALVAACVVTFVKLYEEPTLARRYGDAYTTYRAAVPAWLPRLRAWRG
jgi:protein-S-isoprenylcysteine O-methyltransferase Ste14